MDMIPQLLPGPEGPADRRVDQGVGTYSDYYPDPDPRPALVERLASRGKGKESRGYRYGRPFGEPTEAELLYPAPKRVCLTPEQREINRRGAELARRALEATILKRKVSETAATDTGAQTPKELLEVARKSWEPQQGELF